MKYVSINAFDIPDSWLQVVESILKHGDIFDVGRGSEITRTKTVALGLEITNPEIRPLAHTQAPFTMKYVEEYALEYLFIGEKHEGEEYTYGERLRKPLDQIEQVIEKYKVNVWYTAPTAIRMLMMADPGVVKKYDLSSLRHICSVGEPLNPEAIRWGLEALKLPACDDECHGSQGWLRL